MQNLPRKSGLGNRIRLGAAAGATFRAQSARLLDVMGSLQVAIEGAAQTGSAIHPDASTRSMPGKTNRTCSVPVQRDLTSATFSLNSAGSCSEGFRVPGGSIADQFQNF